MDVDFSAYRLVKAAIDLSDLYFIFHFYRFRQVLP